MGDVTPAQAEEIASVSRARIMQEIDPSKQYAKFRDGRFILEKVD